MATGNKQARAKLFADLRAARDFVLFQPKASRKRVKLSGPVEAPVMPPILADHMKHIVPQRRFQEGSVHYDIQCSPQDYLPCLVYMMRWVEGLGGRIPNVFPLRSSIVPKYIRLDTKLVIQLLLSKTSGLGAPSKLLRDITGNKDAVWRSVFHLERKCFAPQESNKYEFAHTMQTDGIACSLLWNEKGAGEEEAAGAETRAPRAAQRPQAR
ncbi:hypothetical protein BASA81_003119 [Batrachochytrium salamandrivorans]|nr:hypothetical protein BASA81_003119 [Batrachochytrium salamandrivorans]